MAKDKTRIFVDMDGTLAEFKPVNKLETLYEENYFRNLQPIMEMVNAVSLLMKRADVEVFILSAYLSDSPYALKEKNAWLNQYLPAISEKHRIFVPCGTDKREYVPYGMRNSDVLVDDYSANLFTWEPPAKGIKLLNGINGRFGSWQGDKIESTTPANVLADSIYQIVEDRQKLLDSPIKDWKFLNSKLFSDDRGFALAEHKVFAGEYVTWQFTLDNGKPDCYWGHYFSNGDRAKQDYENRALAYHNEYPELDIAYTNDSINKNKTVKKKEDFER